MPDPDECLASVQFHRGDARRRLLADRGAMRVIAAGLVRWRKALGIERFNEGSARLHAALNARKAVTYLRGKRLPPEQVERRRRTAKELGLRPDPPYVGGRPWTAAELALLGTAPDGELAARIDRTATAVRVMRTRLGIPSAADRRCREHHRRKRRKKP